MATQEYVTARRAADLTGLNERTIRRHIASGKLQAERMPDGDYRIPTTALAQLRKAAKERATRRGDLAGEVATLRAEVDALRSRLDALETRPAYPTSRASEIIARLSRHDDTETALPAVARQSPTNDTEPPETHYNAIQGQVAYSGHVWTHADAARWLVRHGIASETTPKSWPGWRETPPTPADVLALALSFADAGNWRKRWRLHTCDDPGCVCHDLLGQPASE